MHLRDYDRQTVRGEGTGGTDITATRMIIVLPHSSDSVKSALSSDSVVSAVQFYRRVAATVLVLILQPVFVHLFYENTTSRLGTSLFGG